MGTKDGAARTPSRSRTGSKRERTSAQVLYTRVPTRQGGIHDAPHRTGCQGWGSGRRRPALGRRPAACILFGRLPEDAVRRCRTGAHLLGWRGLQDWRLAGAFQDSGRIEHDEPRRSARSRSGSRSSARSLPCGRIGVAPIERPAGGKAQNGLVAGIDIGSSPARLLKGVLHQCDSYSSSPRRLP